ncbi:MAG: hypothetical protein AB7V44_17840 [Pseudonocardia sp.]
MSTTGTDTLSSPNGRAAPAVRASPEPASGRRVLRAAIWLPGLAVAVGAAVATAHGLYEVAVAARVPAGIAWLYPLITDGLALVAYAATARLRDGGRRYAWAVVILAAGLSGLAQAAYLATDTPPGSGAGAPDAVGFVAPAALRFGVGAWPAIAAAIVAHLLYLLATDHHQPAQRSTGPVQPPPFNDAVHLAPAVQREPRVNGAPVLASDVQPVRPTDAPPARPDSSAPAVQRTDARALPSPARDRARAAAQRHAARHGALPTVTELETAAEVSRGTAAAVLKHLREHPGQPAATGHDAEKDTLQ